MSCTPILFPPPKLSTKFSGSTNENPSIWAPQILTAADYHLHLTGVTGVSDFISKNAQVPSPGSATFRRGSLQPISPAQLFLQLGESQGILPQIPKSGPGQPNLRHRQPNMRAPAELEVFLEVDSSPFHQSPKTDIEIEKSTVNQRKKGRGPPLLSISLGIDKHSPSPSHQWPPGCSGSSGCRGHGQGAAWATESSSAFGFGLESPRPKRSAQVWGLILTTDR